MTNMEYIQRENLLQIIKKLDFKAKSEYDVGYLDCLNDIEDIIADLPASDVVEVVRCKDCKHFIIDAFNQTVCSRTFNMFGVSKDDFCSHGEKARS